MRVALLCLLCACLATPGTSQSGSKPNVVVFFVDDLGYGDTETFGNPRIKTPYLNALAQEGMKFTSWYSASAICTPSRASLLTGRLPPRTGMTDDSYQVLGSPQQSGGLPDSEITLAEALHDAGYVTGMAGKWHLGTNAASRFDAAHLPVHQGFDKSGLVSPMGNSPACANAQAAPLFCMFYRGGSVTQLPWKTDNLSGRMAREFSNFLTYAESQNKPWFWYHSFIGVHTPLFASQSFIAQAMQHGGGLFGAMVEEMDWEMGQVMNQIRSRAGSNTIVFFTSDNGPYLEDFALQNATLFGSSTAGPFRAGKGGTYEGGFRVPGVVWWPGHVAANTVKNDIVTTMDIFPTVLNLAGAALPSDRIIDGKDMSNILFGDGLSPAWADDIFPYYCGNTLLAARWKNYKIHYAVQRHQLSPSLAKDSLPTPTPACLCDGDCCPYNPAVEPIGVCGCTNVNLFLNPTTLVVTETPYPRVNQPTDPIIFDLSTDIHEDVPLTAANFADYAAVRATIDAKVAALNSNMVLGVAQNVPPLVPTPPGQPTQRTILNSNLAPLCIVNGQPAPAGCDLEPPYP